MKTTKFLKTAEVEKTWIVVDAEDAVVGRGRLELEVVETSAQTGSGSLPDQAIPSWALAIEHSELNPRKLSEALRSANPPVFTRVHGERVLVDFRTLLDGDEKDLARILKRLV